MSIYQRQRSKLSLLDRRLLNCLQEDIPFMERPWEVIADKLDIKEDYLLKRIAALKKQGVIRRISAVFSPRKIGFVSTLVAAKITSGYIEKVAKGINLYPEVTHNYKRDGEYNLWFTLIARDTKRIAQIITELKEDSEIRKISEFPVIKIFKIDVKFPIKNS
ncbi:MAG: Lrp/AsnC ligand binding domain-containing protein [Candidatus Omnitrophica bacterium]|nr:Lrp/AsnC ligand binding domain-containing protein [Candidatus Omnitrophota bacterium]